MERTITVKGTGTISVQPDLTEISISLKSLDRVYDHAMEAASAKLEALQNALAEIGFQKQDLRMTNFSVSTEYDSVRDKNGNYKSVLLGYCCHQGLKLAFDFDTGMLSRVLSRIASCISEPELHIRFSVKDKAAVDQALLESAARNARAKAGILAAASGVKLGELVRIDYSWGELDIYSETSCEIEDTCLRSIDGAVDMDVAPDDIRVSDTASFIWLIA